MRHCWLHMHTIVRHATMLGICHGVFFSIFTGLLLLALFTLALPFFMIVVAELALVSIQAPVPRIEAAALACSIKMAW